MHSQTLLAKESPQLWDPKAAAAAAAAVSPLVAAVYGAAYYEVVGAAEG